LILYTQGAKSGFKGLEIIKHQDFAMIFYDLRVPVTDGAELFRQIKTLKPKLPVTIINSYPDSDMMAQALVQDLFGIMNRLFSESDIIAAVNVLL
jgi:DNA-binding NtrC family response regulator